MIIDSEHIEKHKDLYRFVSHCVHPNRSAVFNVGLVKPII